MVDTTLALSEFRSLLTDAIHEDVPEEQRATLLALGPGEYARGGFYNDKLKCPILHIHDLPVPEALYQTAIAFDRLTYRFRGAYRFTVTP